jgi:mono/diheme cytochrome c family protein
VKRWKQLLLCLSAAAVCAANAQAQDLARGRAIYETRCIGCHSTSVHTRESRKATSFAGVRAAVARFAGEAGGVWQADEIDDVAAYLNQLYYRYPCPPEICKTAKQAAVGGTRGAL